MQIATYLLPLIGIWCFTCIQSIPIHTALKDSLKKLKLQTFDVRISKIEATITCFTVWFETGVFVLINHRNRLLTYEKKIN